MTYTKKDEPKPEKPPNGQFPIATITWTGHREVSVKFKGGEALSGHQVERAARALHKEARIVRAAARRAYHTELANSLQNEAEQIEEKQDG